MASVPKASNPEPLPDGLIDHLILPGGTAEPVDQIQTHISHLFLTRHRVYKIRKAVRFPFLDFSHRDARNRDCLDEVRLNRRLSPDVYLGIAPIRRSGTAWEIGPVAEVLAPDSSGETGEHCVVMRRLPDGGDAQALLAKGLLTDSHLAQIASRLAHFHNEHRLGNARSYSEAEWLEHVSQPIVNTLQMIETEAGPTELADRARALEEASRRRLRECADQIQSRHSAGLSIDGHGDLQLGHIWFEAGSTLPLIIDCTEFNRDFRTIDAASEVSFLAMDLIYRGHPELAEYFLAQYAQETDDYGLYTLVDFYASYRAAVRAGVALLAAKDDSISAAQRNAAQESARDHLAVAEALIKPATTGAVFVTCGIVGSGKSTVARELARTLGAATIGSDRTRKHLAGLRFDDHRGAHDNPEAGLYTDAKTDAVYAGLIERASAVVSSGRCVVLDASFALEAQRRTVLAWASERGIPAYLVEARCAPEVAYGRLCAREKSADDPSDAGPSLYEWSANHFAAPVEWPEEDRARVDTDHESWEEVLAHIPFVKNRLDSGSRR